MATRRAIVKVNGFRPNGQAVQLVLTFSSMKKACDYYWNLPGDWRDNATTPEHESKKIYSDVRQAINDTMTFFDRHYD